LWQEDTFTYKGKYHTVTAAGINPRPLRPIPIWFGGTAPALLERCGKLGDGWVPLAGPTPDAKEAIDTLKQHRAAAGKSWAGFGIQAQAQVRGGDPDRWRTHAGKWRELGATHLAVATHNAGLQGTDAHLRAAASYLSAVRAS
jgi:alkanesulfonate monooxygenase SsuD/methylene tetrahydromethanopterin reductase-like flavin-dependent oxidoreductase (luciferase family)